MKELGLLKEEIEKCVRCGTCRSICPTFRVLGRETACARGKLTLIQAYLDGEIEAGEPYIRHLRECTMCGGCKQSCPNGVDTVGVFYAARAEVIEKQGKPFAASVVFKALQESGKFLPWAMKMASRLQGLLFRDSSVETGLISRFSLPVVGNNRLVPPLAKTFFLDMPEVKALSAIPAGKGPSASTRPLRVAFYAGCGVNYLMPDIGTSSIDVLKRAGAEVAVPSGQVCCGMPAFSMGDRLAARSMALKNLEIFESCGADLVTTSCATCGHGLKTLFRELLGDDPELKKRVDVFSSKVRDITELLVNELHFSPTGRNNPERPRKVTYHDPCHLNRNQGIRSEPRELLKRNGSLSFREMSFPCSCCGLGGGLGFSNYELSIEITRRKIESIRDSGAEIVATACPGCMVQLRDGLHRYGVNAKVAHVVELL